MYIYIHIYICICRGICKDIGFAGRGFGVYGVERACGVEGSSVV